MGLAYKKSTTSMTLHEDEGEFRSQLQKKNDKLFTRFTDSPQLKKYCWWACIALLTLLAVLTLPRTRIFGQSSDPDFTIIVLPDPQWYAANNPAIFDQQIQWIVNNVSTLNIKLVFDVGDTVNGGSEESQWQTASASIARMEGKVPYFLAIGNHDYNANDPQNRTSSASNYNYYFGPTRYANSYSGWLGSYPTGSNESFYAQQTINGKRYLILSLEFYPRTVTLQWAANVIQQNPDAEVLIVTHGYEYFDNTRVALCDNYNAEYYGMGADNDGEEMWQKLVSQYPNVNMVFSGHVVKGAGEMAAAHQTEAGVNGNIVNELLINGQAMTDGGHGYLRILRVSPAKNEIQATTYSPVYNSYLIDSANAYTVPWHTTATSGTGTITGRVKNTGCTRISGAKVSYSGGSTTTDSYGNFTLTSVPTGAQNVSVNATGYQAKSQSVPVGTGLTNSALFFITAGTPTPTPTPPPASCVANVVGVTVCSPAPGTSVPSPVHFVAAAKGTKPVTAMRIYIDNVSQYLINASSLDVSLALALGTHSVVVQAWDSTGGYYKAPLTVTVVSGSPTPTPTPTPTATPTPTPTPTPTATPTPTPSPTPTPTPTPTVTPTPTPSPTPTPGGTGTISGKVTNVSTSGAVSGATVSVSGHSTTSDSSGNYTLSSLTPGTYTVSLSKSGWLPQSKTASVTAGATTSLNFAIATAGKIAGTVKNSSGAAVSGAIVTFKGGAIPNTTSITTSSTGAYSSNWIPVGSYTVTVSMAGHTTKTTSTTVSTGATTTVNFTSF
jgi:Carboxypeptidase regulatory-like domain/Calcineurin-like phosphoesterase